MSGWSLSQNEILEDIEKEAMMCSLASVLHFGWGQEVKRFGLTGKGTEWWLAGLGGGWACSPGVVGIILLQIISY